ncbi:MAG: TIGR04076 family protein [Emergencia timonensis]|uniref:TIGR04076 family protein n=1 Tax=Emergencia timonensis TaxID=1776384 RepID=UPI000B33833E|nr:TIGR04076 family protein [Emergencia timonensis]
MKKPKITITLVDQKGTCGCHRGHKIGDSFDFDTERGALCPMAMHVAFPISISCAMAALCPQARTETSASAVPMPMSSISSSWKPANKSSIQ